MVAAGEDEYDPRLDLNKLSDKQIAEIVETVIKKKPEVVKTAPADLPAIYFANNSSRLTQKEADKRNGIQKKDRTRLGDVFINGYKEHIADYDFGALVEMLKNMHADKVVFFCVEESPYACHRSIVAERIHKLFGYQITHL